MVTIRDIIVGHESQENYIPLTFNTNRGEIDFRYYPTYKPKACVLFLAGEEGEWNSPAKGLYPLLAEVLQTTKNISSVRIKYRDPRNLDECIIDSLVAAAYLREEGIRKLIVVGHSFGAQVGFHLASLTPEVRMAAALSPTKDIQAILEDVPFYTSLLYMQGTHDTHPHPDINNILYEKSIHPKQMRLYQGAQHSLDEVASDVFSTLETWISHSGTRRVN